MALFQTHSGLKHTDEDFCCTIAGISLFQVQSHLAGMEWKVPQVHMNKAKLLQEDKSNTTFTFAPKDFGFGIYSLIYTMSFLSIQLLNKLLYLSHFICSLFPFCFVTFSIQNSF